ncbi:hypothetical protein M413DRAFT_443538 [Hebeloma cylindrosporum]|uniref:Uncharacterized protein n=1 Tax=Hebeloma cylindrosporum TaxID=76867 RepID=A0A0C3CHK7_HEBCY|nr:hypothetical protein M413DRAFT_443538 [Hebeloma cylindrosporum h7]
MDDSFTRQSDLKGVADICGLPNRWKVRWCKLLLVVFVVADEHVESPAVWCFSADSQYQTCTF